MKGYSLLLAMLLVLTCFADLSIVIPSLWLYMQRVCASKTVYAAALTVFNLAQFLASPVVTLISLKFSYRAAFVVSCACLLIGNLTYALAAVVAPPACHEHSVCMDTTECDSMSSANLAAVIMTFAGRAVAGIGGGGVAVTFGLIPKMVPQEKRLAIFGLARGLGGIAMIVAPGLATAFSAAKCSCDDDGNLRGNAIFNQFTLPGYFMALVALVLMVLFLFKFSEPDGMEDEEEKETARPYLHLGVMACVVATFVGALVVTAFQASVVPETQTEYHWGSTQNGLLFLIVGALLLPGVGFAMWVGKAGSHRWALVMGLLFILIGNVADILPNGLSAGSNAISVNFAITALFICMGYSMLATIAPSLMSNIVSEASRPMMMAWIPAAASVARICGPFYGIFTFDLYGSRSCNDIGHWTLYCSDKVEQAGMAGGVILAVIVVFIAFPRLTRAGSVGMHSALDRQHLLSMEAETIRTEMSSNMLTGGPPGQDGRSGMDYGYPSSAYTEPLSVQ
jgi:MFS family permease